ncbi:MAG: chitobiase/beta-hexosaminidase C-terminal domain-containing protein, partial [Bacteroidaceae bacterium]|nr:chitobiase/beta-hexosaminidase C-terminal domain-containing protein [Bacteroidaceae bacterium]
LSFKYRLAYSGSGDINVYVNDTLKATLTADSETVSTFTKEINMSGNVQLKLTSTNTGRPVIDDVSWTPYSGSVVEQVATPTIEVASNSRGSKRVAIATTTEDATIYYTLDGTDPTDASTVYTKAFRVKSTSDVTIKAIAMQADLTDSEIASAVCPGATDVPGKGSSEGHAHHMNGFWQAGDFEDMASFVEGDEATATELDFTGAEIDEAATDLEFPAGINPNCLLKTTAPGRFRKNNVVAGACANLELMDKHPFNTSSSITATTGTYTRNFGDADISGWYSLYLPFAMSQAEIQAAGFTLVEQLTGYNAETKSLAFTPVTATEANVPYIVLFDPLEGGSASYTGGDISLPISGDVSTTNGESVVTNAVLKGTYEAMPAGSLTGKYVLNADGTSFQVASADVTLSPFRVYLELTNAPADAAPRNLSIDFGGEGGTTGVTGVKEAGVQIYGEHGKMIVESGTDRWIHVYGIDGSCVRKVFVSAGTTSIHALPKGLYVVNHQKVVVK